MKRYKKVLAGIGICFCLAVFTACTSGSKGSEEHIENGSNTEGGEQSDVSLYEEKARDFLEALFAEDIDKAEGFEFGEELQEYVGNGLLKEFQGYESQTGVFEEIAEIEITEVQEYYAATALCIFERYEITFVLSFDQEGTMVGFFQQTPVEREEEEAMLPPEGVIEEEMVLKISEEYQLGGILSRPAGEGPFPAVVLVHGSGSSDRNEKLMSNTPFRDIAWGLSSQGIAVYRYDKRTYVYEAAAAEAGFGLYEETVQDAGLAVEMLRSQDVIDSTFIYVAGHSQGGMALPLIHQECGAAGYIMLAGPARDMDVIMLEQYEFLMSLEQNVTDEVREYYETTMEEIQRLSGLTELDDEERIMGQTAGYWKSILFYNQIAEAGKIDRPVLVLQGEEDYQVTMEDFQLWQDTFGDKDNWTFRSYPGLTHMFIKGRREHGPADYAERQDVDQEVIDDMAAFISGLK